MADKSKDYPVQHQVSDDPAYNLNNEDGMDTLEYEAGRTGIDFLNENDFLDWQNQQINESSLVWKQQLAESGLEELAKEENNIFEDQGLFHELLEQNQILAQELKTMASD